MRLMSNKDLMMNKPNDTTSWSFIPWLMKIIN